MKPTHEKSSNKNIDDKTKQLLTHVKRLEDEEKPHEAANVIEQFIQLNKSNLDEVVFLQIHMLLCANYYDAGDWPKLLPLSNRLIRRLHEVEDTLNLLERGYLGTLCFYQAYAIASISTISLVNLVNTAANSYKNIMSLLSTALDLGLCSDHFHTAHRIIFSLRIKKMCFDQAQELEWVTLKNDLNDYLDKKYNGGYVLAREGPTLQLYFLRSYVYRLLEMKTKADADLAIAQKLPEKQFAALEVKYDDLINMKLPSSAGRASSHNQGGKNKESETTRVASSTVLALTRLARTQEREKLLLEAMGNAQITMQQQSFGEAQILLKQVKSLVMNHRPMSDKEVARAVSERMAWEGLVEKARETHKVNKIARLMKKNPGSQMVAKLLAQVVIYTRRSRREGKEVAGVLEGLSHWDPETLGAEHYKNLTQIRCSSYFKGFKKRNWPTVSVWSQRLSELSGLVEGFMKFWALPVNQSLETRHRFSAIFLSLAESVLSYASAEQREILLDISREESSVEHRIVGKLLEATRTLSMPVEKAEKPAKNKKLKPAQETHNYLVYRLRQTHQEAEETFIEFVLAAQRATHAKQLSVSVAEVVNQSSGKQGKLRR